jgi:hypothetical protein
LRAGDARHAVHGENGAFSGGETVQEFAVLGGPDKSDQIFAFGKQVGLMNTLSMISAPASW